MATNFPTPAQVTASDLTVGGMKDCLTDLLTAVRQLPGGDSVRQYTLNGTSFTPLGCDCIIDLPDGVSSGSIEVASLAAMGDGRWLRLKKSRNDIDITVVNHASALPGSFSNGGENIILNDDAWRSFSLQNNVWVLDAEAITPIDYIIGEEVWTGDVSTGEDGVTRKIYKKTILCGTLPDTTTKTIAHGITNVFRWHAFGGLASGTGVETISLPYVSIIDAARSVALTLSSINIIIAAGTSRTLYTFSSVTLVYTCTDR